MIDVLKLAESRYATKKYDNTKRIPDEKVELLKNVIHLSPSSINIQPWKFHFVRNPKVKSQLADASLHNTEKINQSDLLIVFSVAEDLQAFQNVVDENLPPRHRDWYNQSKLEMSEDAIKIWMSRQVYIALGVGLSTAISLGLDSTPMEGIEPDKYMQILNMEDYRPIVALSVGYGAEDDYNRPEVTPKTRRPMEDVVVSVD
ncbi:MAG TPA: NAD(P)H-dependent oxidoreductase [Saprospiraceae bacterium]|nr:NAD(P)H-dependent oxidoreductase [Saprospiraceae bacterium]HPK10588.1 NAD(P)H-dependent oxidoreductase [Saprospiraceae bacterium]HRX30214.1 NAD(P)H-dependent oxidoreductase [Saprospiraceae bacterium]